MKNRYEEALALRQDEGLLRSLPKLNNTIDFYSNDYLGFAKNEQLIKKIEQEVNQCCPTQTGSLLLHSDWQKRVHSIENVLQRELRPIETHTKVKSIRVLGAIGVIELHESVDVADLQKYFVDHGVWIRPFRNLIYIMPPYIIEKEDLMKLCAVMKDVLDKVA